MLMQATKKSLSFIAHRKEWYFVVKIVNHTLRYKDHHFTFPRFAIF